MILLFCRSGVFALDADESVARASQRMRELNEMAEASQEEKQNLRANSLTRGLQMGKGGGKGMMMMSPSPKTTKAPKSTKGPKKTKAPKSTKAPKTSKAPTTKSPGKGGKGMGGKGMRRE